MEEETKAILRELTERLGNLRAVFAPILPNALANLDGWTWMLEQTSSRTVLNRGDEIDVIPLIQKGKTNERGWINMVGAVFSDPDTELIFSTDNWTFSMSSRLTNMFGFIQTNNTSIYCPIYNAATPLGPLYGVVWNPSQFWPYKTQIIFRARHPRTALTPTSQIVLAGLGRHYISDEKLFYETIFLESQKQTIGKVEVPIRRPQ